MQVRLLLYAILSRAYFHIVSSNTDDDAQSILARNLRKQDYLAELDLGVCELHSSGW
jgi:hypothetical protein